MIAAIQTDEYEKLVVYRKKPVILPFTADRRPHCQRLKPVAATVAETERSIVFYLVEILKSPDRARGFGIAGVPTSILLKEGRELLRLSALMPEHVARAFTRSSKIDRQAICHGLNLQEWRNRSLQAIY